MLGVGMVVAGALCDFGVAQLHHTAVCDFSLRCFMQMILSSTSEGRPPDLGSFGTLPWPPPLCWTVGQSHSMLWNRSLWR